MEFGNKRPTQAERVLDYMRTHRAITQREALNELGVWRLASRISELKKNGEPIIKNMVSVTNRFGETCKVAEYRLLGE